VLGFEIVMSSAGIYQYYYGTAEEPVDRCYQVYPDNLKVPVGLIPQFQYCVGSKSEHFVESAPPVG